MTTRANGGWKHDRRSRHERGYGAAWDKLRRRVLIRDKHLCQPCLRLQRVTPAREVDHITPKAQGGTDDESNLQSICPTCHAEKSSTEGQAARKARADGQGFGIPADLKPSACPVIVIAGPPGSGKTTHAHAVARDGDTIIDLDDIAEAIGGQRWTGNLAVVRRALDERDRVLRSLHTKRQGRVILIITGSTAPERMAWVKALGMRARLVVMQTSAAECLRRIKADPARAHAVARQAEVIKGWR